MRLMQVVTTFFATIYVVRQVAGSEGPRQGRAENCTQAFACKV